VTISWYANPGVWSYGAAALAFAWLAVRLVTRWQSGGKPAMLTTMAIASAVAAAAAALLAAIPVVGIGWVAAGLDFVRVAATLGFPLAFLGVRESGKSGQRGGEGWAPLVSLGIVLLIAQLLVGVRPPGLVGPDPFTQQLGHGSALAVAVFGLVLVEQCYRRAPAGSRWYLRPLADRAGRPVRLRCRSLLGRLAVPLDEPTCGSLAASRRPSPCR
jgi:hypothetical protein